jgi:hypothetical protein
MPFLCKYMYMRIFENKYLLCLDCSKLIANEILFTPCSREMNIENNISTMKVGIANCTHPPFPVVVLISCFGHEDQNNSK